MCYAVRIVVVAPTQERRLALRRAAVGAEWEVVAAVGDAAEALDRVTALRARVLVVDEDAAGPDPAALAPALAGLRPRVFLVGVGDVPGAQAAVGTDGLPRLRAVLADVLHTAGDHSH